MNVVKIESVLRSRSFEMFSEKWYKKTSELIYDQFLEKTENEIDNQKNEIFDWFSQNIVYGEIYDSKKIYLQLNKNISQKMMTILLYEFCEIMSLEYNLIRTHKKRNFVLKSKL